ncbi:MAG TPA: HAMP domain-containing sensor histidine kinase, partial [Rubrivivax sp.]|nr:HAMP domain-containing sensor histidine kinase [Rubrivivax sp.]
EPARDHSQEQLAHIERAGWHLLELIDEVLDLSRIESGMLAVSDESVALAPLIADCLNMVRPQARSRGLDLRDESALPPGAQVRADATRLRQVLLNLLSNACKYNRPGGSISVETRALPAAGPDAGRLPADEDADWVEIAVADTGIGLAPDQLASL